MLGREDGLKGYHDISRHPEARLIPGLVLFRWDAPLFFANAEIFSDHVTRAVRNSPTAVRWVVVASEPVTDIDTTGAWLVTQLARTRGLEITGESEQARKLVAAIGEIDAQRAKPEPLEPFIVRQLSDLGDVIAGNRAPRPADGIAFG